MYDFDSNKGSDEEIRVAHVRYNLYNTNAFTVSDVMKLKSNSQ